VGSTAKWNTNRGGKIENDSWNLEFPNIVSYQAVRIIASKDPNFDPRSDAVIGAKQAKVDTSSQVTAPGPKLGPTGLEKLRTEKK
jgi:hypothetical protein